MADMLDTLRAVLQHQPVRDWRQFACVNALWCEAVRSMKSELRIPLSKLRTFGEPPSKQIPCHPPPPGWLWNRGTQCFPQHSLALVPDGTIALSDHSAGIAFWDLVKGEYLRTIGEQWEEGIDEAKTLVMDCHGTAVLATAGDYLYLADPPDGGVKKVRISDGLPMGEIFCYSPGALAVGGDKLFVLHMTELGEDGQYITESDEVHCAVYDLDEHAATFPSRAPTCFLPEIEAAVSSLNRCGMSPLAADSSMLVACDAGNHRLLCWGLCWPAEPRFLRSIGRAGPWALGLGCSKGTKPGEFRTGPAAIAVHDGLIYVAENERIQVLTAEGKPLQSIPMGGCEVTSVCVNDKYVCVGTIGRNSPGRPDGLETISVFARP